MLTPFEDNTRAREIVTNTSVLGKHGRGSKPSSETGDKGADGVFGLRTDFDIPKQVSLPCAHNRWQDCTTHANRWQSRMGTYNYAPHVPAALGRMYDSAIRESTVQTTRCNHTRDCVCLLVAATYNYTTVQAGRPGSSEVPL